LDTQHVPAGLEARRIRVRVHVTILTRDEPDELADARGAGPFLADEPDPLAGRVSTGSEAPRTDTNVKWAATHGAAWLALTGCREPMRTGSGLRLQRSAIAIPATAAAARVGSQLWKMREREARAK